MRSRAVEIAGRSYAVGFWWQTGRVAARKAMLGAAREMAARFEGKETYTHTAIRAEQYGLACCPDGAAWPAKTFSLAAALRPIGPLGQHDAFLGIFCLDDSAAGKPLWWVCGILRGLVAADGDQIFDSKEEALAAAAELRGLLGDSSLTEVTRESPEDSLAYLKPLLGPETPLALLTKEERRLGMLIGVIAVILLLGGGGLSLLYSAYQARQEALEMVRHQAEIEAKKQNVLANPALYFNSDWLTAPTATVAGGQCAAALLALPISSNAWLLEEAVCNPGSGLTVHWRHERGASFVVMPTGANLVSSQQAAADHALPPLPGRQTQPRALLTQEQATAVLYELTQNLASQLNLTWEPPEEYRIDAENTVGAPWQRGQFELTQIPVAALLEPDLFTALGRLPGAMLLSLSSKTNDLTLKGCIYATVSSAKN